MGTQVRWDPWESRGPMERLDSGVPRDSRGSRASLDPRVFLGWPA